MPIRQKLTATGDTSGIIRAKIVDVLVANKARTRMMIVELRMPENRNEKNHFHYIFNSIFHLNF
jgi:hypothetical protein